ncbi:hypothetical protein [Streptomyces iconiensis]|uniref:Uncharacterized protein n=1 Tax=Streptomyces iconiensis TaxID=1384038 RepID=A0ABT7A3I3_9ACTN|nr:hypothetical protein [Streptomyces iconiensis]MDJ1135846.1 hypothetical protein [Streptomyces iconiensis]
MSRTDKTKPPWVRSVEHGSRPAHDHCYGPCDLPPRPTRPPHPTRPEQDAVTRCYWDFSWFGNACCSGPHGRAASKEMGRMNRADNRRDRYAARREARRLLTGAARD